MVNIAQTMYASQTLSSTVPSEQKATPNQELSTNCTWVCKILLYGLCEIECEAAC